jgi:hypothetical protein
LSRAKKGKYAQESRGRAVVSKTTPTPPASPRYDRARSKEKRPKDKPPPPASAKKEVPKSKSGSPTSGQPKPKDRKQEAAAKINDTTLFAKLRKKTLKIGEEDEKSSPSSAFLGLLKRPGDAKKPEVSHLFISRIYLFQNGVLWVV